MAHKFIEIYKDSRKQRISKTGQKHTIVAALILDDYNLSYPDNDVEIYGQSDDIVALQYAYQIMPSVRISINSDLQKVVLVLDSLNINQTGPKEYRVTAEYVYDTNTGTGGQGFAQPTSATLPFLKINFTIGGGTKVVYKSLEVLDMDVSDDADMLFIPDIYGAIGVSEDGVQGTEVPDSTLRVQVTAYYRPSFVTFSFVKTLRDLIAGPSNYGTYNSTPFLGGEVGEVQLRSVSGGGTVVDVIPLTFDFFYGKNVTDRADENFPDVTAKGLDLIDYVFLPQWDATAEITIEKPQLRYVHRLYDPVDYNILQFPAVTV